MMISRRKSSAYKTADKCVFFLGSMTIGLSYNTSGSAFHKKLDTYNPNSWNAIQDDTT